MDNTLTACFIPLVSNTLLIFLKFFYILIPPLQLLSSSTFYSFPFPISSILSISFSLPFIMVTCFCLLALLVFSQGVKGDHGDPIPPSGDSEFQSHETTPFDSHTTLSDQASKDFDFHLTTATLLRQNSGALFTKQSKTLLNGVSKFCLYFKIPRIQLPKFPALNQTIRNCRSNSGLSCDQIQVLDGIFRNLYSHLRDQAVKPQ